MNEIKGEVSTSNVPCINVTWKIPNIDLTSRKIGYEVRSPPFPFGEASWQLELAPNGVKGLPDVMTICLERLNSPISEHSVTARMGIKTDRGKEYGRTEGLVDGNWPILLQSYPRRSLVDAGDFPLSKGTVTVFCRLRLKTQPREASLQLPASPGRSLDSSRRNQNVAGNSGATHSASSHPSSQGSSLSEMPEFEGQVSASSVPCIEVTWEIPNFVQTSRKIGYRVQSPRFSFAQASWCLSLFPNSSKDYPECMFIYLHRLDSSVSYHSVIARMCFKTDRGEEYRSVCTEGSLDCEHLFQRYEKRSHVEACDFLLPNGTATVFCQLRLKAQPTEDLLELPVRRDGGLETSHDDQIVAGNSGATHSASSQPELLNSSTQTDEPQPNSASSLPELLNSSTQTDEPQPNSAGIHNL